MKGGCRSAEHKKLLEARLRRCGTGERGSQSRAHGVVVGVGHSLDGPWSNRQERPAGRIDPYSMRGRGHYTLGGMRRGRGKSRRRGWREGEEFCENQVVE